MIANMEFNMAWNRRMMRDAKQQKNVLNICVKDVFMKWCVFLSRAFVHVHWIWYSITICINSFQWNLHRPTMYTSQLYFGEHREFFNSKWIHFRIFLVFSFTFGLDRGFDNKPAPQWTTQCTHFAHTSFGFDPIFLFFYGINN